MTRARSKQTPTMRERFGVTADDLAEIFGPDWATLTHEEALTVLGDRLSRLVAEHDQAEALTRDITHFAHALIEAVATHGTRNLGELSDTITTNLGGPTQGTTFAHVAIAGLAEKQ